MNRRSQSLAQILLFGSALMASSFPIAGASGSAEADGMLVTDFTTESPDLGWYVVNDNVMGGRSEGGFERQPGLLRFSGRTNTNGGGFSSIRTSAMRADLSAYSGIRLRVLGDGRRYTWRLTTDARWRGRPVGYWAEFETTSGTWRTVDIPFSRFKPQFRGYPLDGPTLDPGQITGMGLMIYDKQDGPFELRLASIQAIDPAPFSLARYKWQNRVLVLNAPSRDDRQLREQLDELAPARDGFADRDMALVILLDKGESTANGRELNSSEAEAVRSELGLPAGQFALRLIGKDGRVKLSRNSTTRVDEIFALIDSMPMRRQEMRDGQ